jgi:mevalonate kinase
MYPSKILVFGEYTILLNSNALAVPYNRFYGELAFMDEDTDKERIEPIRSNKSLKEFLKSSRTGNKNQKLTYTLDFETFEKDLENGLYFKSDIPEESGLGSSGALIAAFFDKYANIRTSDRDILKIRNCLALLESFYHGLSSGIDPLVSYLKSPLLIKDNKIYRIFNPPIEELLQKYGLFLVHGQRSGKTGVLVNDFNNKCKSDPEYLNKIQKRYIPVNNECITLLMSINNSKSFFSAIRKITLLQLEIFNELIPEKLIPLTNYGLENNLFYLKLCGSGGGGYFLGFTNNIIQTECYFNEMGYKILVY